MLSISSSDVAGDVPGLQSVAIAIGTPSRAQRRDRRQPRLAQRVERARQQHGDGAGARHRRDARVARVFEMIGRQRAEFGGERARRPVSESWSACSLTGSPCARAASNTRRVCAAREADRLAERIDGIGEPRARGRGNRLAADVVDVVVGAAGELGRQRVRGEQRRAHVDVELGARARAPRAAACISFAVSRP